MKFTSDSKGRQASRKYCSMIEELYSKNKRVATCPEEEEEVRYYNCIMRMDAEQKAAEEFIKQNTQT